MPDRTKFNRYRPPRVEKTPREHADATLKRVTLHTLATLQGLLSSHDRNAQPRPLSERLWAWAILGQHRRYLTKQEALGLEIHGEEIRKALEASGPTADLARQVWTVKDGRIVSA